jgi:argininosuccinate lyase
MPAYTHYQAAMPVTYGFYLLGVANAIGRDIEALRAAAGGLSTSPLGASAVAGTDLAIDTAMTARLLGFDGPTRHAMDAVASRDVTLRLLAVAVGLTVTLSRLASDLQLWSTAEFGLVTFPDRLVGGSSAMPQKRNAFLLEHVKAKPAHVIGAFAAAAAAMAAAPFTNSIEVGTEAVAAVWPGLEAALDATRLTQVLVGGARPDPTRMRERAEQGFTAATSVANRLVQHGLPFRTAHHMVGDAVRRAVDAGSTRFTDFGPPGWLDGTGAADADVAALAADQMYGGGPGAFDDAFTPTAAAWCGHRQWLSAARRAESEAGAALSQAVRALTHREAGE